MPAPGAPKLSRSEAPVASNAQLRAAAPPEPAKDGGIKVTLCSKVPNPKDFVRIRPLPSSAQTDGKVLARSFTLYRSRGPPSEQVFKETWQRREQQRTQALFTPRGKPYRELGDLSCADPKHFTLRSLGQLAKVKHVLQTTLIHGCFPDSIFDLSEQCVKGLFLIPSCGSACGDWPPFIDVYVASLLNCYDKFIC